MATVYLAHDLRHDRPVALKVLLPELAASLGPERFQREIKLAARLQHPHILTVHDSGQTEGQLWFTMPYIEGESLRDRLRRERGLPLEDALRIIREAAAALDYAHRHGVIHRDVKPENILLTSDGDTLVADFGIARALGGDEHLTLTGVSVGTPAYMSPEQAGGEPELDARSDVYSLGTVLFEMLAGEPPYTGANAQQIIMKRLTDPVPSVRKLRPTVPEPVDQVVQRALAPLSADRYATAAEFARALQPNATTPPGFTVSSPAASTSIPSVRPRSLPVAAIALTLGFIIGLGVLFAWRRARPVPEHSAGPKRVAVLPFENLGDSADAYFADGMTDEVRGKLAQLSGLAVIVRASSNEYRGTRKPPEEIARELGADYLLTATVRWENTAGQPRRVRVSPELMRVTPGAAPTTEWQQGFDASLTDVFKVQADIASKVASALDVALGDSVRNNLAASPTANLVAYDAYLKGDEASNGLAAADPASLRRAIGLYEQAVGLDSGFVTAWVRLAQARALLYASAPSPELAAQARNAAERARALRPDRPEGQLAMGLYYRLVAADNRRALEAYEAGLKLAPNNADLLVAAVLSEQTGGGRDAALPARRMGSTLLWLRRYPEAQASANRAFGLAPADPSVISLKVMLALAQGDLAGARAVVRAAVAALEPARLFASLATDGDLFWVLDDPQQRQLLTLPPSAFNDDRARWALVRAATWHLRGNPAQTRAYADSARLAFAEQFRGGAGGGRLHVLRGLALAYLGRKAEAIAEGERGLALEPVSRDANAGPYNQHQVARIYLLVGEPEKALDQLEPLLKIPYYLSPGWLRIDPTFAPLKGNPRFERLIAGS
jgi:serine/threonine protein kinase/tetratricopeptide (TPR) repeat protein